MLIDKEIPIMPIYSEYTELPKIFSNIYSSNNYTRLDIPKNEFHAYKLCGDTSTPFICDSSYLAQIRNIKIDCESRCFEGFIILFLTFICSHLISVLDSDSGKYRHVANEKKVLFYYVSSKKINEIMFEKTAAIKKILQDFYNNIIDKKNLNRSLTIHVYQAFINYINVFNIIMSGNGLKKCKSSVAYLSNNNKNFDFSKLLWVDKKINISVYITRVSHGNLNLPALIDLFPEFKFTTIKDLTVNYFKDQPKGIYKYNSEFIEYFFNNPHIIDKNDILDSLLLSNYDDVIVLTLDKLFTEIMKKFNLKHFKEIKKMVLL